MTSPIWLFASSSIYDTKVGKVIERQAAFKGGRIQVIGGSSLSRAEVIEDSHMTLTLLRHSQTAQRSEEDIQGHGHEGQLSLIIFKLLFTLSCQKFLSMYLPLNRHIIFKVINIYFGTIISYVIKCVQNFF